MSLNGIAVGGSPAAGTGHSSGSTTPPPTGGSGGSGTGTAPGSGSGSTGSGGGVTFGTYIPFTNYGSTGWTYGSSSTQGGASSAAFPTTLASTGSESAALRLQLDRLRVAFLTAFVQLVRQKNMDLLMPNAFRKSGVKGVTISLQVAPPTAEQIQQAYLPSTNGPLPTASSILSIIA